jgi:outer membrane porin, OprD family
MKAKYLKLHYIPSFAISCASLMPMAASADFVSDSKATLLLRNFYYNHDLRDSTPPAQSKIEEWAQGFILKAETGYTPTPIAIGFDAYAGLGVKLDSSPDRSGSALLPGAYRRAGLARKSDPRAVDEYSEATAAVKLKYSKSELKVGGLFPKNPLVTAGDARLLPQFFEGAILGVNEFKDVSIELGQLRAANYREFSGSRKIQTGNYPAIESDEFDFLGGTWKATPNLSVGVWHGELKDVYKQTLYTTTANHQIGTWKFGITANYLDSSEAGEKLADNLDSRLISGMLTANYLAHTFRAGWQYNNGDSALPFLLDTDLPGVANAIQLLRFDRAGEKSWQARYDFDFVALGLPGLTAMARYVKGTDFVVNGRQGEEWERNIDLTYTVQSGPLKDVSVRWRNLEVVGDATGRRDENRVIISYMIPLL